MAGYIFQRAEINNLFDELRKYGITDLYSWGTVRDDTNRLKQIAKNRGYKGKMNVQSIRSFLKSQIQDAERDLFLWQELPQYDADYNMYDDRWREEQDRIAHPTHLPEYDEDYVRDWKKESCEDECKAICQALTKKELISIDMIPITKWSHSQHKRFQQALINYFENVIGEMELPNHKLVLQIKVIDETGTHVTLLYTLNARHNYKDVVNSIRNEESYNFFEYITIPDKDIYNFRSDPTIVKMISWRYIYKISLADKVTKKPGRKYKNREGNFFPYTYSYKLTQVPVLTEALAKLQIFSDVRHHIYDYSNNCFI